MIHNPNPQTFLPYRADLGISCGEGFFFARRLAVAPKYRKIDPRVWDDEVFDDLDDLHECMTSFYLMTSPRLLRCGVLVDSIGIIAEKTRNPIDRVWDTLSTVCTKFDWPIQKTSRTTVVVIFPRWFRHNPPSNVKHFEGMMSDLSDVPRCEVVKLHYSRVKVDLKAEFHAAFDTLCHTLCHTLYDTVCHSRTISEAVTEAVTEAETETESTPVGASVSLNGSRRKRFQKPTQAELEAYAAEKSLQIDAEAFLAYYESNGWKVGRNPMKCWKSAATGWARRNLGGQGEPPAVVQI